ncbi:hypothetical protein SAMN02910456_00350 [Ruminococcaceae bacterium YRB3002]|nr:hypothetical protein SAMN02910456_00350 [Ruminococcaceae bacterium YRB3002]
MGRGSYTAADWASLRSSKRLDRVSDAGQIFTGKCAQSQYDSRNVRMRESRDPMPGMSSTPIIIGFDVTSSMGYLAKTLATRTMNEVITTLLEGAYMSDPQILLAAVGDVKCDETPLQVTQFESDIRIIKELMDLHLEGGGGGNGGESYNLVWYFAAKHTSTDCYEKRRRKGFIFTIGDDNCHPDLSVVEVGQAFKDRVPYTLSNLELMIMAQKYYNVYHINIANGTPENKKVFRNWRESFPTHSTEININDIGYLSELITSIIAVANGVDVNTALKSISPDAALAITRSIGFIINNNNPGGVLVF